MESQLNATGFEIALVTQIDYLLLFFFEDLNPIFGQRQPILSTYLNIFIYEFVKKYGKFKRKLLFI